MAKRRICLLSILVLVVPILNGCAAQKLIKQGDALMLADRPAEAMKSYREALEKDPGLSENQEFLAKLRDAQALAAFQEGTALAERGEWERAVHRFSESLEFDPDLEKAKDALNRAKKQASGSRYTEALKCADQGKLDRAIKEIERALELNPDNMDAKDALDSVNAEEYGKQSHVKELYDESLALQKEKRWSKSAEPLRRARSIDPSHLLCRVRLHRAEENLRAASEEDSNGLRLLQQRRLDDAIGAFQRALDIWPFYAEGESHLAKARKERKEAESVYDKAKGLFSQSNWDEAVQVAAAALKIFPFHEKAVALLEQSKQKAAESHCGAGKSFLANGKLKEAEEEFLCSLDYVPDMMDAKEGLARADYIRGGAAEKKGLWGGALLWYMDAADHISKNEYLAKIHEARSRIFDRICFGLSLEVKESPQVSPSASAALKSRIMRSVSNQKPDFLLLVSGQRDARQPLYAVSVDPARVEVRSRLVRSENRTYDYTVYREVPNPEIPKLRDLLQMARQDLERLRREFNRTCTTCRGTGRLTCSRCGGKGELRCTDCRGTGKWDCSECGGDGFVLAGVECRKCNGTGKTRCVGCWGDGYATCNVCGGGIGKGDGYIRCTRCNGRGKATSVTEYDVGRKESEVKGIQRKLSRAPMTVRKGFPTELPYVVNYHEKTGLMEVSVSIRNLSAGTVVRADVVRKTTHDQDSTIQNANPGVGLDSDGLNLPSDDDVQRYLIDAVALEITAKVLDAVVKDRISHMRSKANRLKQQGKALETVEAMVDTARLIEPSDAAEAARIIKRLREQRSKSGATDSESPRGPISKSACVNLQLPIS